MSGLQVLMACSDVGCRTALGNVLAQCGVEPTMARSLAEVHAILGRRPVHLIFCDAGLSKGGFREVLRLTNAGGSEIPLVVCSVLVEWDEYLEAMQLGAFDFIAYPYRRSEVESVLTRVRPIPSHKTMGGAGHNIQTGRISRKISDEVWPEPWAHRC